MPVIKLPDIFASHMTLQRGKVLRIEGDAPGCSMVRAFLDGKSAQTPVTEGHFACSIGPFDAGEELYADDTPGEGFQIFTGPVRLTPEGTVGEGEEITGFECRITEDCIQLYLPAEEADKSAVSGEVHISYAQENYCCTHIWNSAGLSMKPFHISIEV